ncbi:hypothetical protein [Deinococcus peraridilitoris]|uniref:Abnormal spindle-like microcephaly-associated protein ASH domain-containing protein n=1 Tax=Deinococcus peraridilitoris (strain DSM 19664 / LMG 22246 / CIP 109416 / KR-200) TaxID=937777 RepID=L0A435_DEIPD|nr:hypothetical protein [Deinococcus peraridilitoris]AFZ68638.1 hypothetical protein Deipe_3195 [Deinococcus peraridilitoris DSM 19664]
MNRPFKRPALLLLTVPLLGALAACGSNAPGNRSPAGPSASALGEVTSGCPTPGTRINFQPSGAAVPSGFMADDGSAFSAARGYGWIREDSLGGAPTGLDLRSASRDRNRSGIDQTLDTLIHLQLSGSPAGAWEYVVPSGRYCVTVSVGDKPYDSAHTVNIEGTRVIDRFVPSAAQEYRSGSVLVDVTDGRLTIDARGGSNTKLNSLTFSPVTAASGGNIEVENLDGVPFADRMSFNRISTTNYPGYGVHNLATLRVRNSGTGELQLRGLGISGPWALADAVSLPRTIAPGQLLDVRVRFTATSGDVHSGSLTISSNDADEPSRTVQLAGFWQSVSEGGQEPEMPELLSVFGYKTVLVNSGQTLSNKGKVEAVGDEVLSAYWRRANTAAPVQVRQLAAFHTQNQANTLRWHAKGSDSLNFILTHKEGDAQSVLPRRYGSDSLPAGASFTPGELFGLKVEGTWSDPTKNDTTYDRRAGCTSNCGHHIRFFPVRDRAGNAVPNTYLMLMDSLGVNYDYNDNVYLISNVRPE